MSGGQRQALTLLMAATDSRLDTRKEFIDMYYNVRSGELRSKINQATLDKNKELVSSLKKELKEFKKEAIAISGKFYDEQKQIFINKTNEIKNLKLKKDEEEEKLLEIYLDFSNALHNFNQDRRILLLDEHTAALDPKTAKKVLELTDRIVREKHLTTLMVTHNMRDALMYGDRLIMFHSGHIIHDFSKEEKAKLTSADLLKFFDEADKSLFDK